MRGAADAAHSDPPVLEISQIFDLLRGDNVVSKRVDQSHDDRFTGAGRIRYDRRGARVVGNTDFARRQRLRGEAAAFNEEYFDIQAVVFKNPFSFGIQRKAVLGLTAE